MIFCFPAHEIRHYSWTQHWGKSRSCRWSLLWVWWDFYCPTWDRIVGYLFQYHNLLFNNKTSKLIAVNKTPYPTLRLVGNLLLHFIEGFRLIYSSNPSDKTQHCFFVIFNFITIKLCGRLPWHLPSKNPIIRDICIQKYFQRIPFGSSTPISQNRHGIHLGKVCFLYVRLKLWVIEITAYFRITNIPESQEHQHLQAKVLLFYKQST